MAKAKAKTKSSPMAVLKMQDRYFDEVNEVPVVYHWKYKEEKE